MLQSSSWTLLCELQKEICWGLNRVTLLRSRNGDSCARPAVPRDTLHKPQQHLQTHPQRKAERPYLLFTFKDLFILFLCMLVLVCMCVYVCTCMCACTHACCPWRSDKGTGSLETKVTGGYKLPIVSAKNQTWVLSHLCRLQRPYLYLWYTHTWHAHAHTEI